MSLGCQVLVCLSHTGINHGDRRLAALGVFDVVFSGHEHHYDPSGEFEQHRVVVCPGEHSPDPLNSGTHDPVEGRGGLGLVSRGLANGAGLSWAKLELDAKTLEITSHSTGINMMTPIQIQIYPSVSVSIY